MKGKSCWMSLVLVAALAAACARPTPEPAFWMPTPEPAFRKEPCPNLPPHLETPQWKPTKLLEILEKLPFIPTDTPVEIRNFVVRVGDLRWTYEYFDPHTGKPVRSECPWLSYEWEFRREQDDVIGIPRSPTPLEIDLYLGQINHFRRAVEMESEVWDPDPKREGEAGEGFRCRCLVHVRPEWSPRWLVISVRHTVHMPPFFTTFQWEPIARVEVPPPPPAPKR